MLKGTTKYWNSS